MSDDLRAMARVDVAVETPEGVPLGPTIDGLRLIKPVTHVDHRGALFEIYDADPVKWPDPVVWIYQTSLYPGVIKGWFVHETKTDRYTITSGTILACFYDDRADSATRGVTQLATLNARGVMQAVIPAGVWHLTVNVGQDEAMLINFPTEPHRHDKPDRRILPWDSEKIPLDVRALLPANWTA